MNRSTVMLVALLLVLGGIAYFLLPSEPAEREASDNAPPPVIHIDSAAVVKIELRRPSGPVTIENVGGRWTVTSPVRFPAEATSVFQLLSGLAKFTPGSLVSSNPDKQRLFQVDSLGTRITVTMRSGSPVSLIIGKTGPSYADVYFRLPDAKEVYLGSGLESWLYAKEVKDWRDRSVLAIPVDAVRKLSYAGTGRDVSGTRDSSGWTSSDASVAAAAFTTAAGAVAGLRADDFADSLKSFPSAHATVTVAGPPDVTIRLAPVMPDSARWYCRTSTSDQTYLISKWSADQILKPSEKPGRKSVAAAPPPKKEPEPVAVKSPPRNERKSEPKVAPKTPPKTAANVPPKVESKPEPKPEPKKSAPPPKTETKNPLAQRKTPPQEERKSEPAPAEQTKPAETRTAETKPAETKTAEAKPADTKGVADDEGELTVHTVKRGETMQTIAKKYNVTVEQVLRWNLLKSIVVKPGQELYIYLKK